MNGLIVGVAIGKARQPIDLRQGSHLIENLTFFDGDGR